MVRPNNNLDPLSQPWARSIEQDIDRLTENLESSDQNTKSVFRSINATLTRLGDQINDLSELVDTQVTVRRGSAITSGFSTTTTDQDFASVNITVPEGYSQAYVFAVCIAASVNNSGSSDYMYMSVGINDNTSREMVSPFTTSGASTTVTAARSLALTDLTGGENIHTRCRLHTGDNPWTTISSRANTEVIITFLR